MISRWYFQADLPTWALFVEIALAGFVVILSGSRLTRLADQVATQFNLGGAWVGALLLATVTSLPEVVTGLTATWIGQVDMAFAAIFGSCSFNIVIIVLLNAVIGGGSILYGDKRRVHILSSSFGIVLISIAMLGVLSVSKFESNLRLAQALEWLAVGMIAVTYILCMRMVYRTELEVSAEGGDVDQFRRTSGSPGLLPKVGLISLILVGSAWWLAKTGDVLADHHIEWIGRPLGATFVGFLFLALATSLPEIATGLSAVKIGNLDMALGNIFGSNMFNIFVIPFMKIASLLSGDALLMSGDDFHADRNIIACVVPILLTGVVIGAMSYRSSRRVLKRLGIDSALLALIYLAGMVLLLSSP
ncbi:MAG: hypothetical protein V3W34_01675 [Phycisphaerae bacterium]